MSTIQATKTTTKTIRKNSKSFDELTANEKGVAIAKDVLKSLKLLRCKKYNTYLRFDDGTLNKINEEDRAQNHVDKLSKKCTVCALGACFLSYVRLYNQVSINELYGVHYSKLSVKLHPIFGWNMNLIESAFEYGTGLKKVYTDDKQRLRAIMHNVVKNKGVFFPEKDVCGL